MKTRIITLSLLFVITFTNAQWQQIGTDIFGSEDSFRGEALSLSADGHQLAIGSYRASPNGDYSGQAQVYTWDGTSWVQKGQDINGTVANDYLGKSISITPDGNRIAIGAQTAYGDYAGQITIYDWNGTSWVQVGSPINGLPNDGVGYTVSLSSNGNRVALSGDNHSVPGGNTQVGKVQIYEWSGTNWNQVGSDIIGQDSGDKIGNSLKISGDGNRVAIGEPMIENNAPKDGRIQVFEWNGTAWTQLGDDINGIEGGEMFGYYLGFSEDGNRLVGTAPYHDNHKGRTTGYDWDGSSWQQVGQSIIGDLEQDQLGHHMAMSADGSTIVLAAYDVGSNNRGYSRVFKLVGSIWEQVDSTISGTMDYEWFGLANALSANGEIVAIGAPSSIANGNHAGAVRVFEGGVLGMDVSVKNTEIIAYPIPAKDVLHINLKDNYSEITITQYNILGSQINQNIFRNQKEIDFQLKGKAGVYIIVINAGGDSNQLRVIKK